MSLQDCHADSFVAELLAPAVYSADTTPVAVDLRGYNCAEIVLAIAAGGITFSGTNKVEYVLTHSDDNSTYTPVTDADLRGVTGTVNGIIKSLVAAKAASSVHRYGYVGSKRYLKLLADFSGTHGTGTAMSAAVFFDDAQVAPTTNQA